MENPASWSADGREWPLCRKLLEPYCREVMRQRSRVQRGASARPVHELRVASRRLQEALEFLAPYLPEGPRSKLYRRARRVRRSLGELRNADVMVELATDVMRRLTVSERTVLRPFLSRLQAEAAGLRRQAIHRQVVPVPGVRKRIGRLLKNLRDSSADSLDSRGEQILSERLLELHAALSKVGPGRPAAMHHLRITVKRYRYALEFLERAGRKELKASIRETRSLQGELGHLHDIDVLLEILRREKPTPATRRLALRLKTERKSQLGKTRTVLGGSRDLQARLSPHTQIRSVT